MFSEFFGGLASDKHSFFEGGWPSGVLASAGNRFTDDTPMAKFVLTLYVAGSGPPLGAETGRLRKICRNDLAGHFDIQVIDVADRIELSGDMRILAPDAVMLWLPAPLQVPISTLVRAKLGLVGLDLRRIHDSGESRPGVSPGQQGSADESKDVRSRLFQLEADLAERSIELAKTREALRQIEQAMSDRNRLAQIGVMAAGIVHDINNPLGAALTSAETALQVKDDPDNVEVFERSLQSVVRSIRRCGQIGKGLLNIARQEDSESSRQNLNQIVRRACDVVHTYLTRQRVTIRQVLDERLPQVIVRPLEIEQVLVNLIQNAVEATDGPATITVRTAGATGSVRLTVLDEGRGMTDEQKERLFDPLYTTRKGQGGTGLGLSVSKRIVTSHRGSITVESAVGEGTTVAVTLPLDEVLTSDPPAPCHTSRDRLRTTDKTGTNLP